MQQPSHGCFLRARLGSAHRGAAEDGSGRAEGQPCPCECPLSPAPGRVAQPSQEGGVSPRLPWLRVPAVGTGVSIPNRRHSEGGHPARSERLGSASHEVIDCVGSVTADTGRQVPAQPQRRWARGCGVPLRWEHSALEKGKIWWQRKDAPGVGGFPRAGRWGRFPSPAQRKPCRGRRKAPVRWRRDGALCGSVPGVRINRSHLGSPVLVFRMAPGRSPPSEKPLPGASRVPPAGTSGAGSIPPSPSTPA